MPEKEGKRPYKLYFIIGKKKMPTALTHGIVGAALTTARPVGVSKWRLMIASISLAILSDLDVIAFKFGIPYSSPFGHRGFSHSLLFSALMSLLVSSTFFYKIKIFSMQWFQVLLILFISAASHGLLDAMTDGGLGAGLFIPFSEKRIFFSFRPIRVSPINPKAFLNSRSLGVLWSEILWVWIPAFSFVLIMKISSWIFKTQNRSYKTILLK